MAARSPSKVSSPRRSLIYVEDDPEAINVAREALAERDLILALAPDMDQAMTLARRKQPEVMLINVDLAGLGATSLMQILRANPATQAAPVIALGKDAAAKAAVKALEAGFFLYLVRPLDAGHLAEALDYALEFSALERTEL